ncbi:unnamed protein product [Musa banksii]
MTDDALLSDSDFVVLIVYIYITSKLWCSDTHPHLVLSALQKTLRVEGQGGVPRSRANQVHRRQQLLLQEAGNATLHCQDPSCCQSG